MSNPTLTTVILEDSEWVERLNFTIKCDSARSTVSIDSSIGDHIFMQGQEADEFNDAAEKLWNETQNTTMDECRAHLARPYIETLF